MYAAHQLLRSRSRRLVSLEPITEKNSCNSYSSAEIGWLEDTFVGREMEEVYILQLGVIRGAQSLTDIVNYNITFMVDICEGGIYIKSVMKTNLSLHIVMILYACTIDLRA